MKRKKRSPWKKLKSRVKEAEDKAEELQIDLRRKEAELRETQWNRDNLAKYNRGLIDQNLKLLQDYHLLASDVIAKNRAGNTYSEVGTVEDCRVYDRPLSAAELKINAAKYGIKE